MERNLPSDVINETNAPECAGPVRLVIDDRILCLDAADAETAIRSVENGTTFCNAGAVRGRSS